MPRWRIVARRWILARRRIVARWRIIPRRRVAAQRGILPMPSWLFARRFLGRRWIVSRREDRSISSFFARLCLLRRNDRRRLDGGWRLLSRRVAAFVSLDDRSLDGTCPAWTAVGWNNSSDLTLIRIYLERRTPAKHPRLAQILIQGSIGIPHRRTGRDCRRAYCRLTRSPDLGTDLAIQLVKRREDRWRIDGARGL